MARELQPKFGRVRGAVAAAASARWQATSPMPAKPMARPAQGQTLPHHSNRRRDRSDRAAWTVVMYRRRLRSMCCRSAQAARRRVRRQSSQGTARRPAHRPRQATGMCEYSDSVSQRRSSALPRVRRAKDAAIRLRRIFRTPCPSARSGPAGFQPAAADNLKCTGRPARHARPRRHRHSCP